MPAFTALALAINLVIFLLPRHPAITLAACLDLVITVPALYYLLVIRRSGKPVSAIWPVVAFGFLRAMFLIPQVGAAGEVALIGVVAWRMKRGIGSENPVLRAIAWELRMFRDLFSPRVIPAGAEAFTLHRESGFTSLLGVAIGASIVEAGGAHLILQRWSVTAAWVMTALSLYGALWLLSLCRSFSTFPVLLTADGLCLRKGMLWSVSIPRNQIATVERASNSTDLAITAGSDPKLFIRLSHPATAEGPYGIRKRVSIIGLTVDDEPRLMRMLAMDR